jgi:hypothetical protein
MARAQFSQRPMREKTPAHGYTTTSAPRAGRPHGRSSRLVASQSSGTTRVMIKHGVRIFLSRGAPRRMRTEQRAKAQRGTMVSTLSGDECAKPTIASTKRAVGDLTAGSGCHTLPAKRRREEEPPRNLTSLFAVRGGKHPHTIPPHTHPRAPSRTKRCACSEAGRNVRNSRCCRPPRVGGRARRISRVAGPRSTRDWWSSDSANHMDTAATLVAHKVAAHPPRRWLSARVSPG